MVASHVSRGARQLSQPPQVFQAFLDGLDMPEHHGRGRSQALMMGFFHDFYPLIGRAFSRGSLLPHPIIENLGASSRDGIETGSDKPS